MKNTILFLTALVLLVSCSKDDELSSVEIAAIDFLNNSPIKLEGVHSQGFESIKSSYQLPYNGLNVTFQIEVSMNLDFRIVTQIEDCSILGNENGRILYRISNYYLRELNIRDIELIDREIQEYNQPGSDRVEMLYRINLRGSVNPQKWPKVTEYQSDLELCDFELPELPDSSNIINTDFIILSFHSFDKAEIDKYEKHLKVLARL